MPTPALLITTVLLFSSLALAQAQTPPAPLPTPYVKLWTGVEADGKTYLYRDPYIDPNAVVPPAPTPITNTTTGTTVTPVATPIPTPFKMEVIELDASRPYFHWAPKEDALRWEGQNGKGLSDSEFLTLRTNGKNEAAGGGFYISKDFTNSDGFGSECVKVTLNKKLRMAKGELYTFFPEMTHLSNFDTQWTADLLQQAGFDGVVFSNVNQENAWWINLYKRDDIISLAPAAFSDFLQVADASYQNLGPWMSLINKTDLNPSLAPLSDLNITVASEKFPILKKLAQSQFNDADRQALSAELFTNSNGSNLYTYYNYFTSQQSRVAPPPGTVLSLFQRELQNYRDPSTLSPMFLYLKSQITSIISDQMKNNPDFRAKNMNDTSSLHMLAYFISPTDLGIYQKTAMTTHFPYLTANDYTGYGLGTGELTNDFLVHYYRSFAFIDLADRLKAESEGNTSIWTLYDDGNSKLYDAWVNFRLEIAQKEADQVNLMWQKSKLTNPSTWNPPTYTADEMYFNGQYETFMQLKSSLEQMKTVASRLSGNEVNDVRGEPVVGGGDYVVNGIHYYRVTRDELQNLRDNPYLSVESVEIPNEPSVSNWVYARHEYPSAHTYKKFKDKLSPSLQDDLIAAEAAGKLLYPNVTPDFQVLTKRILNELWQDLVKETDPLKVYKIAISIHPFSDENGRSMRFLYSVGNGRPLLLRNWDWDIFLSDADLKYERGVGDDFFGMVGQELATLQLMNPNFPKAYDAKSPYAFFFDNGNLQHVADDDYLNEARDFFRNGQVSQRITQKLILETGHLQTDPCNGIMGGDLKD